MHEDSRTSLIQAEEVHVLMDVSVTIAPPVVVV